MGRYEASSNQGGRYGVAIDSFVHRVEDVRSSVLPERLILECKLEYAMAFEMLTFTRTFALKANDILNARLYVV